MRWRDALRACVRTYVCACRACDSTLVKNQKSTSPSVSPSVSPNVRTLTRKQGGCSRTGMLYACSRRCVVELRHGFDKPPTPVRLPCSQHVVEAKYDKKHSCSGLLYPYYVPAVLDLLSQSSHGNYIGFVSPPCPRCVHTVCRVPCYAPATQLEVSVLIQMCFEWFHVTCGRLSFRLHALWFYSCVARRCPIV